MKEIKAYIQRQLVNKVVAGLVQAGAPGITIVEIHPVGYGYEPNYFAFRAEDAYEQYSYLSIVRLEVVCSDHDLEPFVRLIEDLCRTGYKGDGRIFVTEVIDAVRIRDGVRGVAAL